MPAIEAAWAMLGVGFAAASMATFYYAGKTSPVKREVMERGSVHPDAGLRASLYTCPRTGRRVHAGGPDGIVYDVDNRTWATDHECPCGRVHRYHHDEQRTRYDRDVTRPGGKR